MNPFARDLDYPGISVSGLISEVGESGSGVLGIRTFTGLVGHAFEPPTELQ